jgi:hypothetical protein
LAVEAGVAIWLAMMVGLARAQPAADRLPQRDAAAERDDLLQDLLPAPQTPAIPPTDVPGRSSPPPSRPPAGEDLGVAGQDPLSGIGRRMLEVASRLGRRQIDAETQLLQTEILAALRRLGDQAGSASSSAPGHQGGGIAQQQAQPQPSARNADGQPQSAAEPVTDDPEEIMARNWIRGAWGELPQRWRNEIQSPLREEFLPAYRGLIIEYYKQLARQRR